MRDLAVPLMLVCATGTRRGETVELKKVDFDPKRGGCCSPYSRTQNPTVKGDGRRRARNGSQSPQRSRAERVSRMLDDLMAGTGSELMSGWDCLRHSFISICVARGVGWPQLTEWVGHVSPKATKLYTHFNTAESKQRVESVEIRF